MKRDAMILAVGVFVGAIPSLVLIGWESTLSRRQDAMERRITAIQDYTRAYTAAVQNMATNANELDAVIADLRAESERLRNQLIQTNRITEDMAPLVVRFVTAYQELKTQSLTDTVEVNVQTGIINTLFNRSDPPISSPFASASAPDSFETASSLTLDELLASANTLDRAARDFIAEFDRDSQARLHSLAENIR
jgi:hypothetical protein